ncbi:MAG: hypothetical protein LBE12_13140 [Planctomycetaceae bacterium]|nr:hypothetical protein [Planctomycetaceae bacterium]
MFITIPAKIRLQHYPLSTLHYQFSTTLTVKSKKQKFCGIIALGNF